MWDQQTWGTDPSFLDLGPFFANCKSMLKVVGLGPKSTGSKMAFLAVILFSVAKDTDLFSLFHQSNYKPVLQEIEEFSIQKYKGSLLHSNV